MVVYNLRCKKNHSFEGWFPSFEDFQKQSQKKLITCPSCGSTKVEKLPHACAVHVKKEQAPAKLPARKPAQQPALQMSPADFKEALIRVHHYVKENFEDVGPRFAEEAKQIHKGDAEERPIHGTATGAEVKELTEEGIPFMPLPKPELDS